MMLRSRAAAPSLAKESALRQLGTEPRPSLWRTRTCVLRKEGAMPLLVRGRPLTTSTASAKVGKATIFATSKGRKVRRLERPFRLELGGTLPELEVVYEEWGNPHNPVVLLFPSLSVGSHARSSVDDPTAGWWEPMLGPDKGISTEKYRVICPAGLGSPFGTTSPLSTNPDTGKPYGASFPQITPRDMARAHMALLDSLGINHAHALIGASLGGCVALSFASEYPQFINKLCVISCTGKSTPGSVALRHVQRQAVLRDPNFCDGQYRDKGVYPSDGMAIARQLGMITYRTREEFNQRFGWDAQGPYHLGYSTNFEVESYLQNTAKSFVNHYDPNCYLLLSKCTDLMDLGRGYTNFSEGLLRVDAKVMIMGVDSDSLIPLSEQQYMHHLLQAHGKDVRLRHSGSIYGHDAFLLDMGWFLPHIRDFLHVASGSFTRDTFIHPY